MQLASYTGDGFLSGGIGDMYEGVIEAGKDVCNTKDTLAFRDLGTEGDGVFFFGDLHFFGRLEG